MVHMSHGRCIHHLEKHTCEHDFGLTINRTVHYTAFLKHEVGSKAQKNVLLHQYVDNVLMHKPFQNEETKWGQSRIMLKSKKVNLQVW